MKNPIREIPRLHRAVLASGFLFLIALCLPSITFGQGSDIPDLDEIEMRGKQRSAPSPRSAPAPDDASLEQFKADYFSVGERKRAVFEQYLGTLGADRIFDFLEATYPLCHGESHELGQAILARLKELGPALRVCKTRCTAGCMHGVLMEAFAGTHAGSEGHTTERHIIVDDVKARMVSVCREREMLEFYEPGNCAHGIGHALMAATGEDVRTSLAACSSFPDLPMAYYCATGVFMQYMVSGRKEIAKRRSVHFPCMTYTQFPAACYRYKMAQIIQAFGGNRNRVIAECLSLAPPLRLGCFHGFGNAHIRFIAKEPRLLAEICRHGNQADQTVCIEGAIEKLADLDEATAIAACSSLTGENAAVCRAAAKEKMYRLNKPSMTLYYGR